MTRHDDPRLEGRHPEFARMSLRPGIGRDFMHEAASAFLQFNLDASESDVPVTLRHGSRQLPLGRYLRKTYRRFVGRDEKAPPPTPEQQAKMQELFEIAIAHKTGLKGAVLLKNQGKRESFAARQRIFKGRKTL